MNTEYEQLLDQLKEIEERQPRESVGLLGLGDEDTSHRHSRRARFGGKPSRRRKNYDNSLDSPPNGPLSNSRADLFDGSIDPHQDDDPSPGILGRAYNAIARRLHRRRKGQDDNPYL